MRYRHLLVICDGSSEADDAVRAASELARVLDSPAAFAVLYGEPTDAAAEGARELAVTRSCFRRRHAGGSAGGRLATGRRRCVGAPNCPVLQPR